jgi:hypothetical protein
MVTPEFKQYYSVNLESEEIKDCTNTTEANCISSQQVATEVLSLFYK